MNKETVLKNEKAKRGFFSYLRESDGYEESSINKFEGAILLWQGFTKGEDFVNFSKSKAILFKKWLKSKNKAGSQQKVSLGYCYHSLRNLQKFFRWLAKQPGYKSINTTDIDFLKLSRKESRIATEAKSKEVPSYEEVVKVIDSIEVKNEVDQRDRALVCFVLLTGARVSAVASLPIKSFDRNRLIVDQDPKLGVKTKFSKRIVTRFFPLPDNKIASYFLEWFDHLAEKEEFDERSPIFPATSIENGLENVNYYNTGTVKPEFWQSGNAVRKIFEKRFKDAGVKYYHPHTLRHLVVKIFAKARLTEEEKKAISQNLGHEDVGTTFGSYGYHKIDESRQTEIVRNINLDQTKGETQYIFNEKQLEELAKKLR